MRTGIRKIYSYHEGLGADEDYLERQITKVWKTAWTQAGYEPELLGFEHVCRRLDLPMYLGIVEKFPTKNNLKYETACWVRHLAFQERSLSDRALFGDYDVLPGKRILEFETEKYKDSRSLVCFCEPNGGPQLFTAGTRTFRKIFEQISQRQLPETEDHWSDMREFIAFPDKICTNECSTYGDPAWEDATIIHFANRGFPGLNRTVRKLEAMMRYCAKWNLT